MSDRPEKDGLKNSTSRIAGILFLVVAAVHLLRWVFEIEVTVAGISIPLGWSAVAFVVSFLFGLWLLFLFRK